MSTSPAWLGTHDGGSNSSVVTETIGYWLFMNEEAEKERSVGRL